MRHSGLHLMAVSLLTLAGAFSSFAQTHEIPQLNSCIKEFYDPEMYNYLTFKNTCAQSLTVVLIAKDGSGDGATMELRPGGKDSVGKETIGSKNRKNPKPGSFELYVCQTGYVPVDNDNKIVSKPGSSFQCRQRTL